MLLQFGRRREAVEHLQQARAAGEDDSETRLLLARALAAERRYAEALELLVVSLDDDPLHRDTLHELWTVSRASGSADRARPRLEQSARDARAAGREDLARTIEGWLAVGD